MRLPILQMPILESIMKHQLKMAVIVLSALGLAAGEIAAAEQTQGSTAFKPELLSDQGGGEWDRGECMEKRLETLHKDLKLNPSQETAWTEWSDKFKAGRSAWKERHKDFESWANLPVPERMEKMLAFSKERVSRLEGRLAATKTFYATLTPEQRQTFDKQFDVRPHGHFWKGRKD
jgi:Spy/CpxP family protein refolding chaperone